MRLLIIYRHRLATLKRDGGWRTESDESFLKAKFFESKPL